MLPSKAELESAVGFFLGYGRGNELHSDAVWTDRQRASIEFCVQDGLARFYRPPPVDPKRPNHDWSFLRPVGSGTLTSGSQYVLLPDDFAYLEGPITVTGGSSGGIALQLSGEGKVRQRHAEQPEQTGSPQFVAIDTGRSTGPQAGQRSRLWVWPIADAEYELRFQFSLAPGPLTVQRPFPYGGPEHGAAIRAACLAAAELHLDGERGVYWQSFMEQLAASVEIDARRRPAYIGPNRDRSDDRELFGGRHVPAIVTIEGQDPG